MRKIRPPLWTHPTPIKEVFQKVQDGITFSKSGGDTAIK